MPSWTCCRLIGFVLAVWLAIALPEPWDAFLVVAPAPMLTGCAVGDAGFAIPRQIELVGTSALVARSAFFDVSLDVQVGRLWRR